MEFNGTFEVEDAEVDEVWTALSDPVMIRDALPGCQFLVEVEDEDVDFDELREEADTADEEVSFEPEAVEERAFEEGHTYAALMEVGVGSVKPSFETVVTIDNREFPEMDASGEGDAGNSSFEMDSGMVLSETEEGVGVEWWTNADVFGRIAQMGQRMINPAANKVVKQFFNRIEDNIETDDGEGEDVDTPEEADEEEESSGILSRLSRGNEN